MDNIVVVIPVVQVDMAESLIGQMERNSLRPTRLIIIDNSGAGFDPHSVIPISRIRNHERLTVNASWNLGKEMSIGADYVSFFNDDIIIGSYLFEQIAQVMREVPTCGVVCPWTSLDLTLVRRFNSKRTNCKIFSMPEREGWAFTIRKPLLDRIPAIPTELKNFCGDDWFWCWTEKFGYQWYNLISSPIFHYVGTSVKNAGKLRKTMKGEKRAFLKLIEKENMTWERKDRTEWENKNAILHMSTEQNG